MNLQSDQTSGVAWKATETLRRTLPALGIVFGDLGTSPLYTYQALASANGGKIDPAIAMGFLSLVVWALISTISIKYCLLIMRADNHGEGGILALMSSTRLRWSGRRWPLIVCGIFGAALIYGDGIITPAISVLSALEGLNVATDRFTPYIMPVGVVVLLVLFAVQRLGTSKVGAAFGPVMLLWFLVIGVLGFVAMAQHPSVLRALDPTFGLALIYSHGIAAAAILGAVFLAITGGEALYADMGHVGRAPIRLAWFVIVLPALLLNYAGQTALYLDEGAPGGSSFFRLAPDWALYPLVALATLATIIASQAIITGAFSLTRQAMQLGWFPGVRIEQTSAAEYGQIYVPFINWTMMILTVALTISFGSSSRLAGAYGTAVSTTMLLTTILLLRVMRATWRWSRWVALPVFCSFIVIDSVLFGANLIKIVEGGWIPLALGALLTVVMTTWRSGLDAIHHAQSLRSEPVESFCNQIASVKSRSPRPTVFLTRLTHDVPSLIVEHVRQFAVVPKAVIALSVHFAERPRIGQRERVTISRIHEGFWHVVLRFGFMEVPDVPAALAKANDMDAGLPLDGAIFFAGRDRPVRRRRKPRLSQWRRLLFAFLLRNSVHAVDLFRLPPADFIEVAREIEI